MLINEEIQNGRHPEMTAIFFLKDAWKEGGAYEEYTGRVKKIESIERRMVFNDRTVPIDDVLDINGEVVDGFETGE